MDLAALFEGSFEAALDAVEKRAEAVRAGHVKAASGFMDFVDKNIGQAARSGAADRIGNWWRDASADPAKLGLIGAGTGLGLGAVGGMMQPKGRRRPLSGALLGGLMGGAALGGYGLMRQVGANRLAPITNLRQAQIATDQAQRGADTAAMARDPERLGDAITNNAEDAAKKFVAGDIGGGIKDVGKGVGNADVIGAKQLLDFSDKNKDLSVGNFVNEGVGKATGKLEDWGALNKGDGQILADGLKLPTSNPALQGIGALAVTDATMAARANSLYNPKFLQTGLTDASGGGVKILGNALGHADAGTDAAKQLANIRPNRGLGNLVPSQNPTPDLKTALGGRVKGRLTGLGTGFDYTPSLDAGAGATPGHVSDKTLRQVAAVGRAGEVAAAGDAKGFLRSGFGTAQGGRLGPGLTMPRGIVYPAVPATIEWGRHRVQNHNAALDALGTAQGNQAVAQQAVDTGARLGINAPAPAAKPAAPAPAPAAPAAPPKPLTPQQRTQAANRLIGQGDFAGAKKELAQVPAK